MTYFPSTDHIVLLISTVIIPCGFYYLVWLFRSGKKNELKSYIFFSLYLGLMILFFIHLFNLFTDLRTWSKLETSIFISALGIFSNLFSVVCKTDSNKVD